MRRDEERVARIREALTEARLDALVVAAPVNVLLVSGYWPVVGTAGALVTREGQVGVAAPADEEGFARAGWADVVQTFEAGSLDWIRPTAPIGADALRQVAARVGVRGGRVGYEAGPLSEPSTYASMFLYGAGIGEVVEQAIPGADRVAAADVLTRLRSVKTPGEIARIRIACDIAALAYQAGAPAVRAGQTETEAASITRGLLSMGGVGNRNVQRADGYVYCMSGPNAYRAYAAYQRSTDRALRRGDLVLMHCNSYADGLWTDITRTYTLGQPDDRQRALFDAVLAARQAALDAIRPGAKTADVDRAARDVLTQRGFGAAFKHPTGHGVGYEAIDHNAPPRLHPKSTETLEAGMVFNVEPGLYFEGYGGLRHCDMVAVTPGGFDLLTPFHEQPEDLVLRDAGRP